MGKDRLKSGMVQILLANILNMLFSMGTNFLLPKYLPVDSYAQIKTYQLYIYYVAVLHFGYNDGMYLRYGGKNLKDINEKDLQRNVATLRLFQLFISLICISISLAIRDVPLLVASIAILPQNVIAYYKNLFQAIGEFKQYSRVMNLTTGLTFAINIVLIAFVRTDNYIMYISGYLALTCVLWLSLERKMHMLKNVTVSFWNFSICELRDNILSGILLLLGNFSSILLTSMDRWFTKILLGNMAFARYSFAVSMENFLNVAVSPISVTMFNYFCNHDEEKDICNIRELIIGFSVIIVMAAFPIKFIMEVFLHEYMDSVFVIFTLFAAQIFFIIIKSVYVNLYKARKMQTKYFIKLCVIIVVGFIFNIVCYYLYHAKESFAIGTLLSAVVWFFISQLDFQELKYQFRHYVFLAVEVCSFLLCGLLFESIIGCFIYAVITLIMLKLCLPTALKRYGEIIIELCGKISTYKKRGCK